METVKKILMLAVVVIFGVGVVRVVISFIPSFLTPVVVITVVIGFSFLIYNLTKKDS